MKLILVILACAGTLLPQNLLTNPRFAGSLAGWIPQSGTISFDAARNASGALSGSLKTINSIDQSSNPSCNNSIICVTVFPVFECILVTPGRSYAYGGKILVPAGQAASGQGSTGISFWSTSTCGGTSFISSYSSSNPVTSGGIWTLSRGVATAPAEAVSARVYTHNSRIGPTGSFEASFDDLFFQETPLADCSFVDPGNQVPIGNTGFRLPFRGSPPLPSNADVAIKFIATNTGVTPVRDPFLLIEEFRALSGNPVTLISSSSRTNCFSANPKTYVHFTDTLAGGTAAETVLAFRTTGPSFGMSITYRNRALSGLR